MQRDFPAGVPSGPGRHGVVSDGQRTATRARVLRERGEANMAQAKSARADMTQRVPVRTRKLRVVAQDPSVRVRGKIINTTVEVPAEDLQPGPWGCRVQVIDYDSSTGTLLKPLEDVPASDG